VHLDALLFISNSLFGENYYSATDIIRIDKEDILRLVMLEDQVVGFLIFRILSEKSVEYLSSNSENDILEVKSIGVHNAYQGKGLGSYIFSQVEIIARQNQINDCYCLAWKRNNKVAMHNIHINAGFTITSEIRNYWKIDSEAKGYDCPACGNPCLCSAVLYHKHCQ
jgi:ribosomal protein S18 acetylase RimI-like enzyme